MSYYTPHNGSGFTEDDYRYAEEYNAGTVGHEETEMKQAPEPEKEKPKTFKKRDIFYT